MRGFQILSQNLAWIIFDPCFDQKTFKKDPGRDFNDFSGFLAKIGVIYYPSSTVRPYLESSHQVEPFGP